VSGKQCHGKKGRVLCAGFPDGKGGDGYAGRHLNNGEERIEPLQGAAFHRHTENGESGLSGDHAGQVGGSSSTGNDGPQTSLLGRDGVSRHGSGHPVR
jgi:hypothetical protein